MRHWIPLFFLTCLAILFTSQSASGQSSEGGMRVKETKEKSTVYEIRIVGADNPALAENLDHKMMERNGILSCSTNSATGICTMEVLFAVKEQNIREVLTSGGFTIAKKFNP